MASRTLAGQVNSADRHLIKTESDRALVAVVDGLGHGEEAAEAAQAAIQLLESSSERSVIALLGRCHERLRSTRGVVMSVAIFDVGDATMTWVGVGNVEGFLLRAALNASPRHESLLLRNGVVGARLPFLHAAIVPVMPGDTLVFATDGIRSDFSSLAEKLAAPNHPQQAADLIMAQYHKGTDDALTLVVRYRGSAP